MNPTVRHLVLCLCFGYCTGNFYYVILTSFLFTLSCFETLLYSYLKKEKKKDYLTSHLGRTVRRPGLTMDVVVNCGHLQFDPFLTRAVRLCIAAFARKPCSFNECLSLICIKDP